MKRKEVLLLSVTIFFTIVAWIIAELYHTATTEKFKATDYVGTKPLKVNIDVETIKALELKK